MLKDPISAKEALLHRFSAQTILVVGDVMLDQYIWGECRRISPEAPVPVVHVQNRSASLGGAANVALNLTSLGVKTELAGFVGEDQEGERVRQACKTEGIGERALVSLASACTTTKTRIIADTHQMLRIDEEVTTSRTDEESRTLLDHIGRVLASGPVAAVILSDYAKGCCTPFFCSALMRLCRAAEVPVFVDPKGRDFDKYRGSNAIKPNRLELAQISETMGWPREDEVACAKALCLHLDLDFVAATLGPKGILVVQTQSVDHLPTVVREVFDVAGAGDTVIATLVAALACDIPLLDAAALANLAAADVVSRAGTTPITTEGLLVALQSQHHAVGLRKLFEIEDLKAVIAAWRARGQRVAFTNGCFDILHDGHVTLLAQAAGLADRLIVGINSDASVTRLKGPKRPIMKEEQRARLLSALECTDAIVVFQEDTPLELIQQIKPDVLVKGSDYEKSNVVGSEFVESYGGEVRLIPLVHGVSTSYLASTIESL